MAADSDLLKAVIGHYGGETRDGYSKSIRCCFHKDTKRSAVMSTDGEKAGLFYCHTCGIGGDAYSLIMFKEGIDFRAAFDRATDIAKRFGLELSPKNNTKNGSLSSKQGVQSRTSRGTSTRNRTSRL